MLPSYWLRAPESPWLPVTDNIQPIDVAPKPFSQSRNHQTERNLGWGDSILGPGEFCGSGISRY